MNVVAFSFGQTSGYMLRKLMDEHGADFDKKFLVIFENTGREHNATLEFGHEFELRYGVPIVWLEYTRVLANTIDVDSLPESRRKTNLIKYRKESKITNWFKVVDFKSAARIGQHGPFDVLLGFLNAIPNVRARSCSRTLKTEIMIQYLLSKGIVEFADFVGIRKDESHRAIEILAGAPSYRHPMFPLIDGNVTKQMVDAFWDSQSFKLNIPNYMGNCDLCFLKAKWKRIAVARANPQAAQWWQDQQDKFVARGIDGRGSQWVDGQNVSSIIREALHPEFEFENRIHEQDIPCSCAVGGSDPLDTL